MKMYCITNVIIDTDVPVKFWKSSEWDRIRSPDTYTSDTDSISGPDSSWLKSALSDCSCYSDSI